MKLKFIIEADDISIRKFCILKKNKEVEISDLKDSDEVTVRLDVEKRDSIGFIECKGLEVNGVLDGAYVNIKDIKIPEKSLYLDTEVAPKKKEKKIVNIIITYIRSKMKKHTLDEIRKELREI